MSRATGVEEVFEEAGVFGLTPKQWVRLFQELGVGLEMDPLMETYIRNLDAEQNQTINVADLLQSSAKDAKAFLRMMGVSQPNKEDIDYTLNSHLMQIVSTYVRTVVKEKPYTENIHGLDQFSADYFLAATQKRLVLISSNIKAQETFKMAVRPLCSMGSPIITSTYDFQASPAEIQSHVQDLVKKHGVFKTLALASCSGHESQNDRWQLAANTGICLKTGHMDEGINDLIHTLADAVSVRLDILACGFAAHETCLQTIKRWEQETKKNVAASTDFTGNSSVGGDWILETDGIDLVDFYFHAEKLKKWNYHFGVLTASEIQTSNFENLSDEDIYLILRNVDPIKLPKGKNTPVSLNWDTLENKIPQFDGKFDGESFTRKRSPVSLRAGRSYIFRIKGGHPKIEDRGEITASQGADGESMASQAAHEQPVSHDKAASQTKHETEHEAKPPARHTNGQSLIDTIIAGS